MASAATVAASSFNMVVTSPQELIDLVPDERWNSIKGKGSLPEGPLTQPLWVEPPGQDADKQEGVEDEQDSKLTDVGVGDNRTTRSGTIKSKVFRLGHFVETDAVRL